MMKTRERLNNAFWDLLKVHPLHEITISMITNTAQCHRGTFYYHYTDMEELLFWVIEDEFLKQGLIPKVIFNMTAGINQNDPESCSQELYQKLNRFSLLIEKGNRYEVEEKIKDLVLQLWENVLCSDGSELHEDTKLILEYASSGMIGLLSHRAQTKAQDLFQLSPALKDIPAFHLSKISKAQGISESEILARLTMIGNFTAISFSRSA